MMKITFDCEVTFEFKNSIRTLEELREAIENGSAKLVSRSFGGHCNNSEGILQDEGFTELSRQTIISSLTNGEA